ncbi:hypothetical protein ANCDUO_08674 [Ancylostoma duodenale]|uniref:Transmembrane protein 208 n=1 Tax=Ancylostoma duodenale TaxID=51022 RepID=A0A0C2GIN0_9BILA|nr:hypothetical protein ANCDUO_08674 [Ancylostoma duodenale]
MVKQATKGQKEIYEENQSTILTFGAACLIVVVIALYSTYAYLILLVIPAAAAYKVFFGLVLPWITAPTGDSGEEMDDKKLRKRERREKIVYRR